MLGGEGGSFSVHNSDNGDGAKLVPRPSLSFFRWYIKSGQGLTYHLQKKRGKVWDKCILVHIHKF